MDILQLIDRLEELFNESKSIPLTRNVMVDEDRMLDIIDQMRIAIPEEVKKAQQLLGQRDRLLAQAQEEANRTIEIARQKAEQMISREVVAQEAMRRAEQIVAQARAEAEAIRADADAYAMNSLTQLQDELERISKQVANGIRLLREELGKRESRSA
jgi:cell division septum initiation protein DivIVA